MIITTLTAAVSVIQVGGLAAAGVLPLTLIPAVVLYATIGTSEMELGTTDYVVASLSTATVALYFALIGYFIGYFRLESYFDSFPWKQESVKTGAHTWRCPFTGKEPSRRCPSCGSLVHKDAFSTRSTLHYFPGGLGTLRWDLAKAALRYEDANKGRSLLDQVINFDGNFVTGSVSPCCLGCEAWQKYFNINTRLALSLALTGLFFTYVPWAFATFIQTLGRGGIALKILSGIISIILSTSALSIQIKSYTLAFSFIRKHNNVMPQPPHMRLLGVHENLFHLTG